VNWISQNSDLTGLVLAAATIIVAVFVGWLHLRKKRASLITTESSPNESASTPEALTPSIDPPPELIATTFSVELNPTIQKKVFVLHVRNAATSAVATARNVVANIGYKREHGPAVSVDYGAWMERGTITNIETDQTKNLVVALTDDDKNYAVSWSSLRTKLVEPDLVPIGELTRGRWVMVVTVNAENYERKFRFLLTVKRNGVIRYKAIEKSPW
jgi:hypothetical protein